MPRDRRNNPKEAALKVNGFLNFYKPAGITSMEALRQIKRITGQRQKVGHGGTMDPLARGVLPICFGQATRLMDYIVDGTKRYLLEMRLGATSVTYDSEGEITEAGDPGGITTDLLAQALKPFVGVIWQQPPMYSAVKVKGQRLYKLARAGMEVEREAREVEIFDIRITEFAVPSVTLEVECGRGVYMRSLAHDLGLALGCGAYVTDLERRLCGGFSAADGVTLEALEAAAAEPDGWQQYLLSVDVPLRSLKAIRVNRHGEESLRHGQSISAGRMSLDAGYLERFRAYNSEGRFLALVKHDPATNAWQPIKVFDLESPSPFAADAIPCQ